MYQKITLRNGVRVVAERIDRPVSCDRRVDWKRQPV